MRTPSTGGACPPLTQANLLRSFSFCTGIENSAPVIAGPDGRPLETKQMQGLNAAFWLEREWANVLRLRQENYPVIGFTWYSLTDQLDWDIDVRAAHGHVVANGLFDLDRRIRRADLEYRRIVRAWSGALADTGVPACMPDWIGAREDTALGETAR